MKREKSAGAIVFNNKKFLLLKYSKGHWGFVKGHIELGESIEETAIRELEEETGLKEAEIIPGFKEEINYYFKAGDLVSKKVIFILVNVTNQEVKLSHEHVDYSWLNYESAIKKLTFENTKILLTKAYKHLQPRS